MNDATAMYHLGESWPGRGDHRGHTVTAIERWAPRVDAVVGTSYRVSSGRVRCTCGQEWNTAVWPPTLAQRDAWQP